MFAFSQSVAKKYLQQESLRKPVLVDELCSQQNVKKDHLNRSFAMTALVTAFGTISISYSVFPFILHIENIYKMPSRHLHY